MVATEIERLSDIEVNITFDDGNDTDLKVALPRLLANGRRAKFFVCAGRMDRPGYLERAQLRELAAAGMTIGCHGYDHLSWPNADDDQLQHELQDAKRSIEDIVGRSVNVASAPFGALDRRAVRAVAQAGFTCLYSSSGGFATGTTGLIPRNTLTAGFTPEIDLARMAAASNQAWAAVYDTARRVKYGFF